MTSFFQKAEIKSFPTVPKFLLNEKPFSSHNRHLKFDFSREKEKMLLPKMVRCLRVNMINFIRPYNHLSATTHEFLSPEKNAI